MEPKSLLSVRLTALGSLLFVKGACAAILYAAARGTPPAEQGWSLATTFGSPRESVGGGGAEPGHDSDPLYAPDTCA